MLSAVINIDYLCMYVFVCLFVFLAVTFQRGDGGLMSNGRYAKEILVLLLLFLIRAGEAL